MKSFATLIDEIAQDLQDTTHAIWTDTAVTGELPIQLEDAIREISDYDPYIMMEVFKIESRTGTATTTTTDKLVDSAATFVDPDDIGKEIYNTTDKTRAKVTAVDNATTLSISKNIMVSGEAYEMYNKNCRSSKEIYIGDITDYIGNNHGVLQDDEHATEYPLGTKRNVDVSGDILTILVDTVSDSAETDADVEVFIWFKKRHRVSQLTDLLGAISGTPAAGATTLVPYNFAGVEVIAEDTLFTIAGMRGTYRVTKDLTLVAGEGTILNPLYFYPGLDKAGVTATVITVIGSTLDRKLERLVVELTSAKAAISKARSYINTIPKGGANVWSQTRDWGQSQLALVYRELEGIVRGRKPATKMTYRED